MLKLFDLFKIGDDGKPFWLGGVESIEEARIKAKLQHDSDPNWDFCVLNQETGNIVRISRKELV